MRTPEELANQLRANADLSEKAIAFMSDISPLRQFC